MPLPNVNDIMSPPNPGLQTAHCPVAPITGDNTTHEARHGNAIWAGSRLNISGTGHMNYRFIPAVQGEVSYCVVPASGHGDLYIISDQYGGCEYHQLSNPGLGLLAFLHVYRGGGATVQYTIADGWQRDDIKRSSAIAQRFGMNGSNWSVTHINRNVQPAVVQTRFIHVDGYPDITVRGIDNG